DRADDAEWPGAGSEVRGEPARQPEVGNARGVIGVVVREQQRIEPADRHLQLIEPDRGAAPGIDQQLLIAGLDQRGRAETIRARERHAGPEQGNAERFRRAHWCILMPDSLTTLLQCVSWDWRNSPNSDGVPPAGSAASFAIASRTRGLANARLIVS